MRLNIKIESMVCALALVGLFALPEAKCQTNPTPPRSRASFNDDWKFMRFGLSPEGEKINEPENLQRVELNDSKWRCLTLPHDWGIEGPFRQDLEDQAKLPWRAIGWYRKTFTIPKSDQGKRIFIDFDGAMANAKVYLNGDFVGEWPYGYASFRLELTDRLNYGGENVIAVRLDTMTIGTRWYPGAGIYRNVWLVKTSPVHVAHWGTFVTTPVVTKEKGSVNLDVTVDNQTEKDVNATVSSEIYTLSKDDIASDEPVAKMETKSIKIPAKGSQQTTLRADVLNPELWELDAPNRYVVKTRVMVGGKTVDTYSTSFGFRTLKFTLNDGFYLNGKKVAVNGVCNHHDLGPLGTAVNVRARERQLEILKEMGFNSLRCSHNPPEPELLDLCDKMGILVMDETFDTWFAQKKDGDYANLFEEWSIKDTIALIHRDRNHPSVFMWSNGNEIPKRDTPRGLQVSRSFTDLFHKEDPTRPVTNSSNQTRKIIKTKFPQTVDLFGFNYGIGKYSEFHSIKGNENTPYYGSETSSTVSSRGEYFFPVAKGKENAITTKCKADFQVSSYDVQCAGWGNTADAQFKAMKENPACFAEYVWTGFDYLGESTPYNRDYAELLNFTNPKVIAEMKEKLKENGKINPPSRSSYFGIIDLCGFPKDRFYLYQSHWRPELPMAHILPHWNWPERIGKITPVHIYTSGDEAELFLNGTSLGRKKKGESEYRIRFDDVVYAPGTLKVIAYKNGKKWAEDTVKTTGAPESIAISADRPVIKADGKDLSFLTVKVVDKDGLMVPRSKNELTFSVTGPGKIVAIGNGDATSHESFHGTKHKVFNGMCLVIVKSDAPGSTILHVEGDKLKPASFEITAK